MMCPLYVNVMVDATVTAPGQVRDAIVQDIKGVSAALL
jgi:hypothetical protein